MSRSPMPSPTDSFPSSETTCAASVNIEAVAVGVMDKLESPESNGERKDQPVKSFKSSLALPSRIFSPLKTRMYHVHSHPWFQILLISGICFCCPGMYNALTGIGGSGQVDQTVAANATVALLSAMAGTALFVVGPLFDRVGPRVCLLLGAWTYPLYSGALLNFSKNENGAFVISAGALLGIGASFVWVSQGAIMTTYVPENQKGRAIALFWVIFNLGGGVGSLASFGLNYKSVTGTVSDATYIALLIIMGIGWLMSVFICPPDSVRKPAIQKGQQKTNQRRGTKAYELIKSCFKICTDWRVLCMIPLFFCANIFYSYQQNEVNGMNFNIRTRSLNGALYWLAQMFGGLFMGVLLDMPSLTRPQRACVGWGFLFASGMCIWGGGYAFQKWSSYRIEKQHHKQDIDFTWSSMSVGPMFLYIFYGAYDAFWQSFCYWLIGAFSNQPKVSAILVGGYKTFQSVGGAMAWRIDALKVSPMTQFAMNWGMCMGALVCVLPTVLAVTLTSTNEDEAEFEDNTRKSGHRPEPHTLLMV
ncbi:major facilitator superfamily domain-containing protein [Talaromyces proteolyticus]|uniref:Major facilitator superfamily domain-containing protein n=1 Tax=Talaromyces proteolyticus TaxID=1131652 RepID=A0AAD4KH71_9EURO|nr:major facilitator superfamily domain-containing protein [Talaromyces proteolyticus]KAH8690277.1 major facilitator superfamily domain-containing protein [Talaromyces proteolyticus]